MNIEICNLSKSFNRHTVIHSLNLKIPVPSERPCQTLLLMGSSGCGKSTLLRLFAGLLLPDHGQIWFNGCLIPSEEKALEAYRKGLAVVFQSWNLFPHLTALENIILPLYRVHHVPLDEARERSLILLKRFSLDKHAHKRPYELSGGQVQRIALIRAVAGEPKMVLLDEPTSALDPLMTAEVLELILELKIEKRNLILATHHVPFARRIGDHILFLHEGTIAEQGSPAELFDHPRSEVVQKYMSRVIAFENK